MANFEQRMPFRDVSDQVNLEVARESNPLLLEMQSVHIRLSQALKEVDGFMATARELYCADQLSAGETRNFTTAMTEMAECVEAWRRFFKTAGERSSSSSSLRHAQEDDGLIDLDSESLSCSGFEDENMFVMDSPPAPSKSQTQSGPLFVLTPLNRGPSKSSQAKPNARATPAVPARSSPACRPVAPRDVNVYKSAANRPSPAAEPCIPRDGKACHTPAHEEPQPLLSYATPESMELVTPQPAELARKRGSAPRGREKPWPRRLPSTPASDPNSAESPKSVCKPANLNGSPSPAEVATPTACIRSGVPASSEAPIGTPYGTPVLELRRPLTPFSVTRSSIPILDEEELTNSTIQRMGVKGLEEELWRQMKAWHIDTNLRAPYAKLRASSGIPLPNQGGNRRKGE